MMQKEQAYGFHILCYRGTLNHYDFCWESWIWNHKKTKRKKNTTEASIYHSSETKKKKPKSTDSKASCNRTVNCFAVWKKTTPFFDSLSSPTQINVREENRSGKKGTNRECVRTSHAPRDKSEEDHYFSQV